MSMQVRGQDVVAAMQLACVAALSVPEHSLGLVDRAACRHAAAEDQQRLETHGETVPARR